jgi:hypothetical protein
MLGDVSPISPITRRARTPQKIIITSHHRYPPEPELSNFIICHAVYQVFSCLQHPWCFLCIYCSTDAFDGGIVQRFANGWIRRS